MTYLYMRKRITELPVDFNHCRASVMHAGAFSSAQCSRKVKVRRNDVGYCAQHDPEAIAGKREREELERAAWNEVRTREESVKNRKQALIDYVLTHEQFGVSEIALLRMNLLDALSAAERARARHAEMTK